MECVLKVLKEAKIVNFISDRNSIEYVLEKLSLGFPVMSAVGGTIKIGNEAIALLTSTELSTFITASQFAITVLTDLWESREGVYGYGTRYKGEYNINSPCVGLFGATVPEFLVKSIPNDAAGNGFVRRVNFSYAKVSEKRPAFFETNGFHNTADLVEDLRDISTLRGAYKFDDATKPLFAAYYDSCEPVEFEDQATSSYKTSKWVNALKAAMCFAAAEGSKLVITPEHWLIAEKLVEDVARDVKIVFRAVGASDIVVGGDKVLRYLDAKGYASKGEMLALFWQDITADDLDRIIATFREARLIGERTVGNRTVFYKTGGKP